MERVATLEAARAEYTEDVVAWSGAQAALLRAGRLESVDIENIAEEIESVGASQKTAMRSQIRRIIEHLLKLEFSTAQPPRHGWKNSVRDARDALNDLFSDSPSLRQRTVDTIHAVQAAVAQRAIDSLQDHGELNDIVQTRLTDRRYSVDQVTENWFPDA